jgi:hypothetical protein
VRPPADAAARTDTGRPGDLVVYEPRPALPRELTACSFRHPLCAHATADDPRGGDDILAWIDAAERAWDVAEGALGVPPPDPSFVTGALDLYVVDGDPYVTRTLLDRRDPAGGFDRASAYALVARHPRRGCSLDTAASRLIARAILFRVAPASDRGSALAESAALARLMTPCRGATDDMESAYFQAHPEVGLADTLSPPDETVTARPRRLTTTPGELYAAGASLFYDWIDDSFGGYPGAIVRALWALRPTKTPPLAQRWSDEPDGFDVLRETFKGALTTGSKVDDLWLDFAVARALVPRYPVRIDWSIAWPEAPRTLLSGLGVAPTGAAYLSIDCEKRRPGARLRFEAHWEPGARILWALVRVDASGREMSRVAIPAQERGIDAQTTLVDLDGVARVLIVGASAGDPRYQFDPDDYRWEPHGWVVSVAAE